MNGYMQTALAKLTKWPAKSTFTCSQRLFVRTFACYLLLCKLVAQSVTFQANKMDKKKRSFFKNTCKLFG